MLTRRTFLSCASLLPLTAVALLAPHAEASTSFEDLLRAVAQCVQDNPGSKVTAHDDLENRRVGFVVTNGDFKSEHTMFVTQINEAHPDYRPFVKTAKGRARCARHLQDGLNPKQIAFIGCYYRLKFQALSAQG